MTSSFSLTLSNTPSWFGSRSEGSPTKAPSPITDGVLGSKPKPGEPARLDKSSQLVYFYRTDAARLGEAVYANDTIVNLGMNWLTRYHMLEGGNCDVCSITSQFLTRFCDVGEGVETANKLTKHCTNVFEKKLILMPLNTKKSHWLLVVIVNPGAILDNKKESVILHLDSLSCHNTSLFHDFVLQWLNYRWKKEHQDMTDDVFTRDTMKVVFPAVYNNKLSLVDIMFCCMLLHS
jgi:Ulp1 protease family, C-terminal catalytic domain